MGFFPFFIVFLLSVSSAITLDNKPLARLEVYLTNFESDAGNVRVQLFNQAVEQYFPDKSSHAYRLMVGNIHNKRALIVFDNIPYGTYAVTVHHDENLNIKMDKNFLGMPAEGWGLSRNIIPIFHLPHFKDCDFDVKDSVVKVYITVRNLP